ncbi:hypothetical protein JOB18_019485 [Solea senegalensis]|uniref:Uncharacterized protein n=1 Tax=Solea senegalensis TaxID=28829 RepID=A0AAV6RVG8_SOLSE|nr:hypothetical protein JOB18_019485 [Solea senegalensis]
MTCSTIPAHTVLTYAHEDKSDWRSDGVRHEMCETKQQKLLHFFHTFSFSPSGPTTLQRGSAERVPVVSCHPEEMLYLSQKDIPTTADSGQRTVGLFGRHGKQDQSM